LHPIRDEETSVNTQHGATAEGSLCKIDRLRNETNAEARRPNAPRSRLGSLDVKAACLGRARNFTVSPKWLSKLEHFHLGLNWKWGIPSLSGMDEFLTLID
jgi:hypothetical protein